MFIRCEQNNDFERFYIPDLKDIEELKKYAEINMPILAYRLGYERLDRIFIKEQCTKTYLYLNNYLYYYQIDINFITRADNNKFFDNYCKKCRNDDGWGSCCDYNKKTNSCKNFKEKKSIFNIFKTR